MAFLKRKQKEEYKKVSLSNPDMIKESREIDPTSLEEVSPDSIKVIENKRRTTDSYNDLDTIESLQERIKKGEEELLNMKSELDNIEKESTVSDNSKQIVKYINVPIEFRLNEISDKLDLVIYHLQNIKYNK